MSPFELARELDRDPGQTTLKCAVMLAYASMKRAYEDATPKGRQALQDLRATNPALFDLVDENTMEV